MLAYSDDDYWAYTAYYPESDNNNTNKRMIIKITLIMRMIMITIARVVTKIIMLTIRTVFQPQHKMTKGFLSPKMFYVHRKAPTDHPKLSLLFPGIFCDICSVQIFVLLVFNCNVLRRKKQLMTNVSTKNFGLKTKLPVPNLHEVISLKAPQWMAVGPIGWL